MLMLFAMITVSLLLSYGIGNISLGKSQQQTGTGMVFDSVDLSLKDLVNDSKIIVLGNVVDQNSNGTGGEDQVGVPNNLMQVPLIRNAIQVEEVIKGNYTDKTIDVATEGDLTGHISMEGNARLYKGERVILFLYPEKIYAGKYSVTGMEQGKYHVDSNGQVRGKFMQNGTSLTSFEATIQKLTR